jgi:hypothetical protein
LARVSDKRCGVAHTAVVAALLTIVTGCGGNAHSSTSGARTTSTATGGTSPSPSRRRPPRHPGRPRGAPVGTTQQVHAGTSTLSVTVSKVIDPLSGSGAVLVPGTRAVGVEVTIRDDSGATYDSAASGDLAILSSAGAASPLFANQGVCQTPLADFESLVGVGEERSGCVAFAVPRRARIVAVSFSPHSRSRGRVIWR